MAQVNIKASKPKFSGDKVTWKATVSGGFRKFPLPFTRILDAHGLSCFKNDGDFQVWTSPSSFYAPPFYLTHLLRDKYGFTINKDVTDWMNSLVGPRPLNTDGLEGVLGNKGALPPGRRPLQVFVGGNTFMVNCDRFDAERRMYLRGAGWLPVHPVSARMAATLGTQPYFTNDPFMAGNLEGFMDNGGRKLLSKLLSAAGKSIANSRSMSREGLPDYPIAEGQAYLDYQARGVDVAVTSPGGAMIFDDMGLGKTIQGIGTINATPAARNVLVACQANMRYKWAREINKFKTNQNLTVGYAEGDDWPDTDIVVINYDIADRHADNLRSRKWDIVICDEAHNVKNIEAKRTIAILGGEAEGDYDPIPLSKDGFFVHMSGTPRPRRNAELWNLVSTTRPDLFGKGPEAREIFEHRYSPPFFIRQVRGSKVKVVKMTGRDTRNLELQLRLRGSGSMVRRMKDQLEGANALPPKMRSVLELPVKLSKEEIMALRDAEADLQSIIDRVGRAGELRVTDPTHAGAVLDILKNIPQDSPQFHEISRVRSRLGQVKAKYCIEHILGEVHADEELDPEFRIKRLIFAHHKEVVEIMAQEASRDFGGKFLIYNGAASPKRKQEMVDRYQEDPSVRFMFITLSAASGITLTSGSRMFKVEYDWNPSNAVQVEDRLWRIGQGRSVLINYMCLAGTLDGRIGVNLADKTESEDKTLNAFRFSGGRVAGKSERKASAAREAPALLDGFSTPAPAKAVKVADSGQLSFEI